MAQFPFHDRQEILKLADLYWTKISARDASEERAFEHELPAVRMEGFLSKPLFVRLARWKSARNTPNYESNAPGLVRDATAAAFEASSDADALRSLMQLRGVALRTASAILHWMRPDRFPILDFRVVGALGEPEPDAKTYEDTAFYSRIAERVRILAAQQTLDLRTVDRALWVWQKSQAPLDR